MEQLSQNTTKDLGHQKGLERFPHNRVGLKKEGKKKRRGSRMGSAPMRGSWSRGEVPTHGEGSTLTGKSVGTEGEHLRLLEEGEMADLWQTGQSETYTDGLRHSPARPRLGSVSASAHRGWELECGDWRANLGKGLLLAARRQPEGTGGRKSITRNACGGNLDCHRTKMPLLSDVQGVELTLQPLCPRTNPLSCQPLGKALTRANLLVPASRC